MAYDFLPGQMFSIAWWRCGRRKQHWTLAVVQAVAPDEHQEFGAAFPLEVLPGISRPARVIVMLDQGVAAGQDHTVDRMLDLIAEVRRSGTDPAVVKPAYWRAAAHAFMLRRRSPAFDLQYRIFDEQDSCETPTVVRLVFAARE